MRPRSNEISQQAPRRLIGAIGVMRTGLSRDPTRTRDEKKRCHSKRTKCRTKTLAVEQTKAVKEIDRNCFRNA